MNLSNLGTVYPSHQNHDIDSKLMSLEMHISLYMHMT